jgi:hypothetical protein
MVPSRKPAQIRQSDYLIRPSAYSMDPPPLTHTKAQGHQIRSDDQATCLLHASTVPNAMTDRQRLSSRKGVPAAYT